MDYFELEELWQHCIAYLQVSKNEFIKEINYQKEAWLFSSKFSYLYLFNMINNGITVKNKTKYEMSISLNQDYSVRYYLLTKCRQKHMENSFKIRENLFIIKNLIKFDHN